MQIGSLPEKPNRLWQEAGEASLPLAHICLLIVSLAQINIWTLLEVRTQAGVSFFEFCFVRSCHTSAEVCTLSVTSNSNATLTNYISLRTKCQKWKVNDFQGKDLSFFVPESSQKCVVWSRLHLKYLKTPFCGSLVCRIADGPLTASNLLVSWRRHNGDAETTCGRWLRDRIPPQPTFGWGTGRFKVCAPPRRRFTSTSAWEKEKCREWKKSRIKKNILDQLFPWKHPPVFSPHLPCSPDTAASSTVRAKWRFFC